MFKFCTAKEKMKFKYYVMWHKSDRLADPKLDEEMAFNNPVSRGDFISDGRSSGRVIDIDHTPEHSTLKVEYV